MKRKKGFTLIELMIVLAVIAMLSTVVVPKVGAIKVQSKNYNVSSNVLLVRSYLENRNGRDAIAYQAAIAANPSVDAALNSVLTTLGTDMVSNFTGSNAITNPFSSNNSVVYSQGNVTNKSASTASSVLAYYCTDTTLPDSNIVGSSAIFPKGTGFIGDVIVVLYSTGYVLYGIDNSGQQVNINIINFPVTAPSAMTLPSGGAGSLAGSSGITGNLAKIVPYIQSIAINKIITGAPDNQVWPVMRTPLYSDLYSQFTPGSSNRLVNPYYAAIDTIIDSNSTWADPSKNFAIMADSAVDTPQGDTKYLNFKGSSVVYVTSNPLGYVVYGVDNNGNAVGRTAINLSTLITSDMANTLSNNVASVCDILRKNIDSNLSVASSQSGAYNQRVVLQTKALAELQSLGLKNAYIPTWTDIGTDTNNFYNSDKTYKKSALVVELQEGSHCTDFKGTVIVNALPDASGYEVYGMDYTGNKYCYAKLVGTNAAVGSNVKTVVDYLNSQSDKLKPYPLWCLLYNKYTTNIMNPYNKTCDIIYYGNNQSNQNSVIVFDDFGRSINYQDYQNYKGSIIVQEIHDNSGANYDVFGIGYDGSIIGETQVSF